MKLVLLVCFLCAKLISATDYTVYNFNGNWEVKEGARGGVADALYEVKTNQTGWAELEIVANPNYGDSTMAFAAGFLEAAITHDYIYNTAMSWQTGEAAEKRKASIDYDAVSQFALDQDKWVRQMVAKNSQDDYWIQVGLAINQFDGAVQGYQKYSSSAKNFTYLDLLMLQLGPELGDISQHFQAQTSLKYNELPIYFGEHCSVLIKLTDSNKKLICGHDTWSPYEGMLRVYKIITLPFHNPSTAAKTVSFSSYPGNLESGDDFYMTSANLAVMETTNDVFNMSLYKDYISTETVPEWIRVIVANRMSPDGRTWAQVFSKFNSGTYNNQWQILDFKKFTPGSLPSTGALWISEQIPGFVQSADVTNVLNSQGYWPSYNIPYFPFIYNISGYPEQFKQKGNTFSYSECARAQIFRRDQSKVQNVEDFKKIMRYNQYQSDPLALQDACRGISARCDLNTPWQNETMNGFSAFGAIDCKITDEDMIKNLHSEAVSGPSWDNQPPFAWTRQWANVGHFGQPKVFNFHFVPMSPKIQKIE